MRLLFAIGVVISHGPYLHFKGRFHHDPIYALTRIQSLGDLCVDAFFVLSGFLVTQSFERSATPGEYLAKRALRVYPAFAAAYVLSCLAAQHWIYPPLDPQYWRILILQRPPAMAHFQGVEAYAVNLPLWTISYEFRAYLFVMLFGMAGLLAKPRTIAVLTGAMLALLTLINLPGLDWRMAELRAQPMPVEAIVGNPYDFIRLNTAFLVGASFYLCRERLLPMLTGRRTLGCLIVMVPAMFWRPTADTMVIALGAFILFWLAFRADFGRLQPINDRWDISYGIYLYGWPITVLTIAFSPRINDLVYYPLIVGLSALAGAASWFGLERFVKYRARPKADPAPV